MEDVCDKIYKIIILITLVQCTHIQIVEYVYKHTYIT